MSAAATAHDWRLVAPWYRWEREAAPSPAAAAAAARPALHKYTSTEFVAEFLADPQRSVVFDPDVDVHQQVRPIPAAELTAPDGRRRSLSVTRLVPSDTRKLFQPAHSRFYLVAVGLHCDAPGFPRVDPDSVAEVGFVVRRHRVIVPEAERVVGASVLRDLGIARAKAAAERQYLGGRERGRLLTPFRSRSRRRVTSGPAALAAAERETALARRKLQTWATAAGVEHRTEAWVASGQGTIGAWVPLDDEPEELVERVYPMRLLAPPPDDPVHAAHEATIYYGAVPTGSDEVAGDGSGRFNATDTYEIRVVARLADDRCPGPLTWSAPSESFRLASFYDPQGCQQRPTEVQLPDFAELEASTALPSVRMNTPDQSSLVFPKNGEIPKSGSVGGGEICFFSIPLITIVAMFVLNIFLPIVLFVFQLWWMLKLRLCIPPSLSFEADLAAELQVDPPGLEIFAEVDVDVWMADQGIDPADVADVLAGVFNPDDPVVIVPPEYRFGDELAGAGGVFTEDPLVKLLVREGYGRAAQGGAPDFDAGLVHTAPVGRDEVVHP